MRKLRKCQKGMSGKRRDFTISMCVCPSCRKMFPIPRLRYQAREAGHQKRIWCPFCGRVVNTTEIRYNDRYRCLDGSWIREIKGVY